MLFLYEYSQEGKSIYVGGRAVTRVLHRFVVKGLLFKCSKEQKCLFCTSTAKRGKVSMLGRERLVVESILGGGEVGESMN